MSFTLTKLQFSINSHLSFNSAALLLPSMKIENCKMKIAPERSV